MFSWRSVAFILAAGPIGLSVSHAGDDFGTIQIVSCKPIELQQKTAVLSVQNEGVISQGFASGQQYILGESIADGTVMRVPDTEVNYADDARVRAHVRSRYCRSSLAPFGTVEFYVSDDRGAHIKVIMNEKVQARSVSQLDCKVQITRPPESGTVTYDRSLFLDCR